MSSSTSELVTVVTGLDCPDSLIPAIEEELQSALVDLDVVAGGQPFWPAIIGVE
jgi:hypothetical protein